MQTSLESWQTLCAELGGVSNESNVYNELCGLYSEKPRHYHNLDHIEACLLELEAVRHLAMRVAALKMALWFHDAIYDTYNSDNEERSARLAESRLRSIEIESGVIVYIAGLIRATRHSNEPEENDTKLMVDIDLAILGKPEKMFIAYEKAVRREYWWVPEAIFARKRAKILRSFLERPALYATDHFRSVYEERARANIKRSLEHIAAGTPNWAQV